VTPLPAAIVAVKVVSLPSAVGLSLTQVRLAIASWTITVVVAVIAFRLLLAVMMTV